MARIYLDARAALGNSSGVGRYVRGLVPELAAQAPRHDFVVIRARHGSGPSFPHAANVIEEPTGGTGSTADLLLPSRALRRVFRTRGRPDLYHSLFHLVPFGIRHGAAAPRRVVVTLHDCIWIDYARQVERTAIAAAWRRQLASVAIPYALRASDHVICNSDATAHDAERWIPRQRLTTIHHGVDREFLVPSATVREERGQGSPYVAAFGVPKAYKNIGCLVRAFARLRERHPSLRLVLIGGDGGVRQEIERLGLTEQVTVVRAVTDANVRALLRNADVFVLPSVVEGFGLPILEAMAVGTPVVASSVPALREVAADAALFFDPSDPADLAERIDRVLTDTSLRAGLAARGSVHVSQFTWSRAAACTLAVYERVLSVGSGLATGEADTPGRAQEPQHA